MERFEEIFSQKLEKYQSLISRNNFPTNSNNGIYQRYEHPILTAAHTPIFWRYDLDQITNPFLEERLGINSTFNSGAIYWKNKYLLIVRIEGNDRKSFFGIAESPNGIDQFEFWDYPIQLPQTDDPDTNVYDMRMTAHEDGYIYGLFCTERKDTSNNDTSSAIANCGIVRTNDFKHWERLPDLKTRSSQQRNVVLHPEFIEGKYAFYTRPQDGFITVGSGGGIGWGLSNSMNPAIVDNEKIVDNKVYHTIKELKNGQGPTPIKTEEGWLHLAHGVRNTAAGLRYTLYLFLTDLFDPSKIIAAPGGHFMAPIGSERVGDVSNVLFSNGWIKNEQDEIFIYYASSDTRMHVATTTVAKLLDYVKNSSPDPLYSHKSVALRSEMIRKNLTILGSQNSTADNGL